MNNEQHKENTLLGISLDHPAAFSIAAIGGLIIIGGIVWSLHAGFSWVDETVTTALHERSQRKAKEMEEQRQVQLLQQERDREEQLIQQEQIAQSERQEVVWGNEVERSRPGAHLEQGTLALTATRPQHIIIDKVGVDATIEQPINPSIDVLDEALKKGAVHYPGSGTLEHGNMFIFGHSTNWLIVQNQAYKTFNDLEDLVSGDEIKVRANGKEYVYLVQTVELVDESVAFVDLSQSQRMLTISTCNSFGKKQDRWVVQAVFDREYLL